MYIFKIYFMYICCEVVFEGLPLIALVILISLHVHFFEIHFIDTGIALTKVIINIVIST